MSFRDIKGQDNAVGFLKVAAASGRIAATYVFFGPDGVGKKMAALNFAKALNCGSGGERPCDPSILRQKLRIEPRATSRGSINSGSHPELVEGCDKCGPCVKIDKGNHPDVFVLEPEEGKRSVNMGQIRELIRTAGLKPYEARKKVYIIDEAEELEGAAQNALLKTLEEPPPDTVIILIASELDSLFPTIRSRSQALRFFALGTGALEEILTRDHGMEPVKARLAARIFSGRIGRALESKRSDFFEKRLRILDGLADGSLFDSDFDKAARKDLKNYLDIILTWYRDLLVCKTCGPEKALLVNVDRADAMLEEAGRWGRDSLEEMIREVVMTGFFLDANVNAKLAMGVLGIKASAGIKERVLSHV